MCLIGCVDRISEDKISEQTMAPVLMRGGGGQRLVKRQTPVNMHEIARVSLTDKCPRSCWRLVFCATQIVLSANESVSRIDMWHDCGCHILFGSIPAAYLGHWVEFRPFILTEVFRGFPQSNKTKQTPWSESASELYRPSDRRLSAK
jgi:hypothetical protein